ncbi:MAG: DUF262 domain-containing protein [Imperialibacter sp.]|uniref:DUF262 domain-containing protein n=1 Tax=Imperialibacter sp. TaxID=2038411 RepID=UPI0032EAE5C7
MKKLDFSIPANNQKIIELYNKLKKGELDPSPSYQRKLVWRKQHKYKFIETILWNFPFPEIYIAPGEIDTETLVLTDQIVDGQQRLTTILNYIEAKDVFSLKSTPIKAFSDLSKSEKEDFLNYEISVRYLKNASEIQIREIFQRINSTEYSLNTTERINAQWGDSEFICLGKQIIEKDLDVDTSLISYKISPENRDTFLNFFHERYQIFTDNDINRMLALQFVLTLLATICEGEYFRRNDKVQEYIESYFEEFNNAGETEIELISAISFIESLGLASGSYWFNKSNIFTLIVECYKLDTSSVDIETFRTKLELLEQENKQYLLAQSEGLQPDLPGEDIRYFDLAKEAVNDKPSREYRGQFISRLLTQSMKASS